MKSIWNKLASTFVEFPDEGEEDAPEEAVKEEAKGPPVKVSAPAPAVASSVAGDPSLVSKLDQSTKEQLLGAMDSAGAELVEELLGMLDTLRDSIPTEPALYQAALKILIKKDATLTGIEADFQKVLGALEAKDHEFATMLQKHTEQKVGAQQAVIDSAKEQIEAKKAQIDALQAEISDLGVQGHEAEAALEDEKIKLQVAQSRFTLGYNRLHSEMEGHLDKVLKHGAEL